jgi:AAA domain, putative AbiEii toxin, Type IV TA system/AAA ATPase domain/Protein of unknown function (DUF3696)
LATSRRQSINGRGITGISVTGFKSLRDPQHIDIRPLTIIAGVNSSGKSSIVQPLLLLKQTVEAPYDPGPLLLNGPNVSITRIEQILSRGKSLKTAAKDFTVGFGLVGEPEIRLRFGKVPSGDLRLIELQHPIFDSEPMALSERMSQHELEEIVPQDLRDQLARLFSRERKRPSSVRFAVTRERWSLHIQAEVDGTSAGRVRTLSIGPELDSYENEISRIIHLPAFRGNPRRTYPTAAVEEKYPGPFNEYTAGIVAAWQNRAQTGKITQLRHDLEHLGLTWKVEARQLDDTSIELLVGRLPRARQGGARDLVNIADVGFGVSQTLPVIVALLAASTGQLVYLEQPEIHLHPRAQAAFADLLCEATKRGVRVLVETHSALLIRGIQTLVAKGDLSAEDVALHWFSRDSVSGSTTITSATLDSFGAFGDWPEDFDEVQLRTESDYLSAAEAAEAAAHE